MSYLLIIHFKPLLVHRDNSVSYYDQYLFFPPFFYQQCNKTILLMILFSTPGVNFFFLVKISRKEIKLNLATKVISFSPDKLIMIYHQIKVH